MKEETIQKAVEQAKHDITYKMHQTADYRESWKIFRIMAEFVEGYQFLSEFEKEVTILGSARLPEDNAYYQAARTFGRLLGENGFTTVTGGGPGIMEAANRGAHESGGESIGLNIQLPFEQRVNPYVKKSAAFYYFFTRKVMLTSPAHAFAYFPGGFGTLDEFFEVVDHVKLGKMCDVPMILFGSEYWNPLIDFLRQSGCNLVQSMDEATISKWKIVDDPQEALSIVQTFGEDNYKACELSAMNFHSNKDMDWRVFRIMAEMVEGFDFLSGTERAVTILGTKSLGPGSEYYQKAHRLGELLADEGYAVLTGGAAGIAEAANRGAFEHGGVSIGLGLEVGGKMRLNKYVTKSRIFKFPFTRKMVLSAPTKGFVFFPGGFGTMHQLFEVLTLIQTKKVPKVPVILVDHKFWEPLHKYIKEDLYHSFGTISDEDDELYQIVDDVDAVMELMREV